MSGNKKGSEAAKKAWEVMRRRGKPPKFDDTPQGRIQKQIYKAASSAIGRAQRDGLDFDEEWMLESHLRIAENGFLCEMTGLKFDVDDISLKTKGAGGTHFAPSPDQIKAGDGYIRGNVRWVLWAVNRAKGEMPEELFAKIFCEFAKRHVAKG